MATLDQIAAALRKADAAGNVEDARALAQAYRQMRDTETAAGDPASPSQQPQGASVAVPNDEIDPADLEGEYQPSTGGSFIDQISTAANGFVDGIPIIGPALTSVGHHVDAGFNNLLGSIPGNPLGIEQQTAEDRAGVNAAAAAEFPVADIGGRVAGAVVPLAGLGATAVGARALGMSGSLGSRVVAGGTSGGIIGAADAAARGGDVEKSAITGAALGGALPLAGKALGAGWNALRGKTPPKAGPSLDSLRETKNAAYQVVDDSGVRFAPEEYQGLVTSIDDAVHGATEGLSAIRHPQVVSMVDDIKTFLGTSPTPSQIDKMRQVVNRDLVSSSDNASREFGRKITGVIDDFLDSAGQGADLKVARAANRRYRKTEEIDTAIGKADLRANSTGTGGNIDNATRQNIRAILDSPKRRRGYSAEELAQMERVVRGTRGGNIARQVGRLSPTSGALPTALALGGSLAGNPGFAALGMAGMGAKILGDRSTLNAANRLRGMVSGGAPQRTYSLGEFMRSQGPNAKLAPASSPAALGAMNDNGEARQIPKLGVPVQ